LSLPLLTSQTLVQALRGDKVTTIPAICQKKVEIIFRTIYLPFLLKILLRILPRKKSQSPSFKELLSLKSGCKNMEEFFNIKTILTLKSIKNLLPFATD
jgi:hypothetical protein